MTSGVCYHCGKPLPPFDRNKVPFRETCSFCGADLHVCKNCRYYSPGRANDCLVPGTEYVADREKFNFCEEYSLLGKKSPEGPSKEDIEKKLFG